MGVATAIAIGGLAVTAASTTNSFIQAGKQKKAQRAAEAKAAEAMAEAKKRLEVNFAENRSIQKEPYEVAREAITSMGAQNIQAGVESDRGAEVTAGKVQMAQNLGQAEVRGAMGQEMTDIEKDIINEDSRLADLGMQLNLGEVEGQQLAARDAEENRAAAITEGMQGLQSMASQGLDMVPLFPKTGAARQTEKMKGSASKQGVTQTDFQKNVAGLSSDPKFGNLSGVGAMKGDQFDAFMGGLDAKQLREMRKRLGY
jgi:hypothetical protein